MKSYKVSTAEKLKEAVALMKWQKDKDKVAAFARVWSAMGRGDPKKVANVSAKIELGRSAQIFKVIGTDVTLLGNMNLNGAREFVKELEEA